MIKILTFRAFVFPVFLAALCHTARAGTLGDLTYQDSLDGLSITITDCATTASGALVIPDTLDGKPVKTIGYEAFASCSLLTGVTIPEGVTTIDSRAFINCLALATVTIPSTVVTIGDSAFYSCQSLVSVAIPSGVTVIGNSVFDSCRAMVTVTLPAGITSIGNNAFYNCNALTGLTIPSGVTSIGSAAFGYCSSLVSVVVPFGVTVLKFGVFADCVNLTSVTLPAGLTTLEGSVFGGCTSLPAISIPASVNSIGTFAFTRCSALTAITIPSGVTSIGTSTFEYCSSLTSVTIPPNVTTIGGNAFRYCTSLASITIPASVTSIASAVNETVAPTSDNDVFGGCSSLTSIQVNAANAAYESVGGVLFKKGLATLYCYPRGLAGPYTIPTGVTRLDDYAFRFCVGVTSIHIPIGVANIDTEVFIGCSQLDSITVASTNTSFSSVDGVLFNKSQSIFRAYPGKRTGAYTIPGTVITIGRSAFRYCSALTEVTIPSSVVNVRESAFSNCGQLAKATFTGNAPTAFDSPPSVFQAAASGFKVWFNSGATGFTTPTWQGYPSSMIGVTDPLENWFVSYGLPVGSDPKSDANRDGVSLLMAYALNLNPNQNLSTSVPQPVFSPTQMSLSYYSGAAGVTYQVQASEDLKNWSDSGVSVSGPDANQVSTATVNRSGPLRFMRLAVSY